MPDETPMQTQWQRLKQACGDAILLFRCGDFYETFGEDARTASRVLDIALTRKHWGKGQTTELAGVPYHAVQGYIYRLTRAGYRVALCEQLEDPATAKGLVRRDVVRTITPGTIIDADVIAGEQSNYLAAIEPGDLQGIGLAYADITTGEFRTTQLEGNGAAGSLLAELSKILPSECLAPEGAALPPDAERQLAERHAMITRLPAAQFDLCRLTEVEVVDAQGAQIDAPALALRAPLAARAAGAVAAYVRATQKSETVLLGRLALYQPEQFVVIDSATERNLDLVRHSRDGGKAHTLLSVLDFTQTPMGARLLRQWILRPLCDPAAIGRRLDAVEVLVQDAFRREALVTLLRQVADLERVVGRVGYGNATGRDLLLLAGSLERVPEINGLLAELPAVAKALLEERGKPASLIPLESLVAQLRRALLDEQPVSVREGNIIREGYHPELDELRAIRADNRTVLAKIQQRERERTGIGSLKVAYNKVFGYYIEVSKANLDRVPSDYVRKQTLVSAERFITDELKEYEAKILGAQERITALEYELFRELLTCCQEQAESIRRNATLLGQLDVLCSFALAAVHHDYRRPVVDRGDRIEIEEGRHPVIERAAATGRFVPNDTRLDNHEQQLLIITGPNMAGKSTYIRQVALITLMAQIGSFVPARAARIGVTDRIFSRVGASDNLAAGQSTFMVEMSEAAAILAQATPRSLIVLDEIGRGTSTFDGISLAWSIAEYIHNLRGQGVKTLFATHYHELAELESRLARVKNYRVLVAERGHEVTFLYRVERGHSDHSYGIAVAELAGVPAAITRRARSILKRLESGDHLAARQAPQGGPDTPAPAGSGWQLSLFSLVEEPLARRLREVDIDRLSPMDALQLLAELRDQATSGH